MIQNTAFNHIVRVNGQTMCSATGSTAKRVFGNLAGLDFQPDPLLKAETPQQYRSNIESIYQVSLSGARIEILGPTNSVIAACTLD